jgi:hypothetical protein
MNVLTALQNTTGKHGIGISLKSKDSVYTKYFLFSQIKSAEKFYNEQVKQNGSKKVTVNLSKIHY